MSDSLAGKNLSTFVKALDRLKWTSKEPGSTGCDDSPFCWSYVTPVYRIDLTLYPLWFRVKFTGYYDKAGSYEHQEDFHFNSQQFATSIRRHSEIWVTRLSEILKNGALHRDTVAQKLGIPWQVYGDLQARKTLRQVWVTKYWSTRGIELDEVEFTCPDYCYGQDSGYSVQYGKRDWHFTYEEAVEAVLKKTIAKGLSLEKQLQQIRDLEAGYVEELKTRTSANFRQKLDNPL